ncbi:response regulator [Roseiconus lacunae]|uniref:Response regulator n=1 Tax=Roseiconus lacunae TaxID=2605694 RepID=A0ABT7PD10_9BACT|nr:response regulator [Roseiconus lacunae]MDM4014382.1 response regulator [Roseiconus lacunae]
MNVLLVDDEAQVLRGVARTIECEAEEWEVHSANSAAEALECLDSEKIDVIVTDMSMPQMDGAELLEIVEIRFPNVLRIVLSGQADRDSVLRAIKPMHQYLSKPCDPDVLLAAIRRAEIYKDTITSSEVLDAVGRANCLPTLPSIVAEINQEIDSDHGTIATIASVVSRDPVLSAKILQIANSAIFSVRQPILDVEHGLSLLGVEMVRSLAISLAVFSTENRATLQTATQLFEHSVDVANIARTIASVEEVDSTTLNTVLSAGLLHDIGKMILFNAFSDRYTSLISRSERGLHQAVDLEKEEFGCSHPGIGAYLLERWGVPKELTDAVAAHHSLGICSRAEIATQIVYAANWIATHPDGATPIDVEEIQSPMSKKLTKFLCQLKRWSIHYRETQQAPTS